MCDSVSLSLSISHTVVLPLSSLHPLSAWSAGPAGGVSECCEWVAMVDWTAILRCEHHSSWIRRVLRHPAWLTLSSSPCLLIRCNMEDVLIIRMGILQKGFCGFDHLKIENLESHRLHVQDLGTVGVNLSSLTVMKQNVCLSLVQDELLVMIPLLNQHVV